MHFAPASLSISIALASFPFEPEASSFHRCRVLQVAGSSSDDIRASKVAAANEEAAIIVDPRNAASPHIYHRE